MSIYKSPNKIFLIFLAVFLGLFGLAESSEAANRYVRQGASGNGSDWANAYGSLPSALTRGDTYYLATGSYGAGHIFDDAVNGTLVITIKKATVADHGTSTGWSDSYGTGQAIFTGPIIFATSYYTIDGNGTHIVPSTNTLDYGIKVSLNTHLLHAGYVQITNSSNITIRYVHVYNAARDQEGILGSDDTIALRVSGVNRHHYKIQNSYFQNCTTDGMQFGNSKYVLIERSVVERLGRRRPYCGPGVRGNCPYAPYGQVLQFHWPGAGSDLPNYIVVRWNKFIHNEGQAILYGENFRQVRFYGNIIYNKYGQTGVCLPSVGDCTEGNRGFNNGIVAGAEAVAATPEFSYVSSYNNTHVNLRDSLTDAGAEFTQIRYHIASGYSVVAENYLYNNLYYNSNNSTSNRQTGHGYHASGGYGAPGGTNAQTGLSSSIFVDYTKDDYRVVAPTAAGLNLAAQSWWNESADTFFGTFDSRLDMYGNIRGADGTWDRGAYEYVSGVPADTTPPAVPTGLSIS
ncbi:MAG: hypothetical protein NUV83_03060 [Candidatus Wolfebacteria bacterium]|nr:hypothetical protein [Candidatus Wolfebacteria bacterium]